MPVLLKELLSPYFIQRLMTIELFYFSGTGNSYHIAKELSQRLSNVTLTPIVKLLDRKQVKTNADVVGFVFPTYFTSVPAPVRSFLKTLNLSSAHYIFSITTRGGTFCVANMNINRMVKKKGKMLDAHFILDMIMNTPTGLKPGKGFENWDDIIKKENIEAVETTIQSELDEISQIIKKRRPYPEKQGFHPIRLFLERLMYLFTRNIKAEIKYITDETCTGCGLCEQVCLSKKVRLIDRKPIWDPSIQCYYCYACFNICPTQSILVKNKYLKKDGRYIHPQVTVDDIAQQKGYYEQSELE